MSMYMLLHSNPINLLFVSVPSADHTIKEELVLRKRSSLQASPSGRHTPLESEILLRCLAQAASLGGTGLEDLWDNHRWKYGDNDGLSEATCGSEGSGLEVRKSICVSRLLRRQN